MISAQFLTSLNIHIIPGASRGETRVEAIIFIVSIGKDMPTFGSGSRTLEVGSGGARECEDNIHRGASRRLFIADPQQTLMVWRHTSALPYFINSSFWLELVVAHPIDLYFYRCCSR